MTPQAERPGDDPRRETLAMQPDRQSLLDQLRDANEQLVVSSMQNPTLADAADRARADAETANRLKDEFLAMVSHELRTPLSAILGCAHLLDRGHLDQAQTMHAIHVIERNAKAAARIIDDLLDVSRIIGGSIRLDRQPVDLSAVVQEALDALRLAADAKAINVIVIDHAVPALVAGDSLRLTQVVENLLANAVKFTPRGGRIEVRLTWAGSQVEIQVADTGQGIAPEFLPHLFERFSQAKMLSTRQGGIGLGLAIVKALVEGHGGSVHADSPGVGEGATFTVRLPVPSPRELAQLGRVGGADTPAGGPTRLDGLKILLVEDDADTRDVLRLILEIAGAEVEASGSARGALRTLDDFRPDVLVSDIGMPDEDGYALIRHTAMTGYVGPIESETLKNTYFRRVLFSGKHAQLVVMCLQPGEEIGKEMHPNVDQFFRIEQGEAKFVLNETEEHLVRGADAVVVPAGTHHNVINASRTTPLKLYTIYSPPNHPDGTVHKTKSEAEAAEAAEHDR